MSGNVYLYQRFSSSAQEGNSSLYRQGLAQQEWLDRNPDCVVKQLDGKPLVDSKYSAYKSEHLVSGSLGRLINAIEENLVDKGSIILVEHFSRLSRMSITVAGKLLDKIWDHEVTIVTARDNAIYSPEMRDDMATRMRLIVEIDKAHSDSKWRSEKVKGSWQRRELNAKVSKIPPRMRMPFWLDKEGRLNEHSKVVQDVFRLHSEGLGQVLIERELRRKYGKIKPLTNFNPTKVIRILQSEKCIGMVFGERLFEPVVDDETFYNAQRICKERLFTSVREDRKWALHGLVKCASCGSGMSIQQSGDSLPLLRCSRKQRSGGEFCDAPTTFPYVVAYHFFKIYVEPVILASMSNLQRNNNAEQRKLQINQKLKKLYKSITEAEAHYQQRIDAGKKAISTLSKMDDLRDDIDSLVDELALIQSRIEVRNSMISISKEMHELSYSDDKQYNLELNKLGLKIWLKDKELSFGLVDGVKVAKLKYLKYDRKRRAYLYTFSGDKPLYKTSDFSSEVRTDDWSIERLLKPNNTSDFSPSRAAAIFNELKIYDESGPSFGLSYDE